MDIEHLTEINPIVSPERLRSETFSENIERKDIFIPNFKCDEQKKGHIFGNPAFILCKFFKWSWKGADPKKFTQEYNLKLLLYGGVEIGPCVCLISTDA